MKLKEKTRYLSLRIFGGYQVRLVLSNRYQKSLEKHGFEGSEPDWAGITCTVKCSRYYIFTSEPEPGSLPTKPGMSSRDLRHFGDKTDNEVIAYLLAYIVDKFHETDNER